MAQAFHPIAELFPLMEGKEFEALVGSIKEHGLREPIWRDKQNRIVDGRNRYRACIEAGIAPKFRTWEGKESDLPAFIADLNLVRRHLTDTERALIAGEMANMPFGGTGENQHTQAKRGTAAAVPLAEPISTAKAAEIMGVGTGAVERARAVAKHPDLKDEVKQGKKSLTRASKEAAARNRGEKPKPKKGPANPNLFKHPPAEWHGVVSRAIETIELAISVIVKELPRAEQGDEQLKDWQKRLGKCRTKVSQIISVCEKKG